jgi:hypothetical protein
MKSESVPASDRGGAGQRAAVGAERLAWFSLISSVAGWLLFPVLPFGPELLGIALGAVALSRLDRGAVRERRIAKLGLAIGGIKLVVLVGSFLWVVLAFMRNPVAH